MAPRGGALAQPSGMGMGGVGPAASYPAAVNSGSGRPQVQEDVLAVFNASNAQASEVGTSTDQASAFLSFFGTTFLECQFILRLPQ